MNSKITILLISHKSKDYVLEYIKNIYNKFEIIIIDNSNDKNLEKLITENYPEIDLKFMENKGYGAAINFGSRFVKTDYFIVSNPDIKGLNEKKILMFLDASGSLNNNFSVLGPRFLNVNPKSHKQSINNNDLEEMKFLSGACMFFFKENFDKIGGFDENFFLYFEENDFCLRSHKIYKNYQVNNIQIEHNVGQSVKIDNINEEIKLKNLRSWHFIWSKFYYYKKHYGFLYSILYLFPTIIRIHVRICYYSIINNKENKEKYLIRWSGLISSILNKKSFKRID